MMKVEKKKWIKVVAILSATTLLTTGILTVTASDKKAGGYSYVKEDGKLDLAGYFTTENSEIKIQEESIDFIMQSDTATITFNKPLASDNFQLGFDGVAGNTLESAEFVLTDAENSSESISFSVFRMSDTNSTARPSNSDKTIIITGSLCASNNANIVVGYDASNRFLTDGATYTAPILESLDGSVFSGFSSHTLNVSVRLKGQKGSVFRLKEINMQRFGTYYEEDKTDPVITTINPLKKVLKNSIVTIPQAFALDVLAERATMTMSVTGPDGKEVKTIDGTVLTNVVPDKDYQINVEQYGYYRIGYKATDGTNTTRTLATQFEVVDSAKPTIELSSSIATSVKTGQKLVFPDAVAKDNITKAEDLKVWIDVKYPDGHYAIEEKEIVPKQEGVYEITWHTIDEAGNLGSVTLKTYAEGE